MAMSWVLFCRNSRVWCLFRAEGKVSEIRALGAGPLPGLSHVTPAVSQLFMPLIAAKLCKVKGGKGVCMTPQA